MTDEERLDECRREIFRLRCVVKSFGERLDDVEEYAKKILAVNRPYLYGKEERPNDLYDCGYIDGQQATLTKIMELIGADSDS